MDPSRRQIVPGAQTMAHGTRVVIVDDDASVRHSMQRLVRSLGLAAEAFGSAEEFLAADVASLTLCLILDVRMPGMSGLALQDHLVASGLRVPIVFVTAVASDDEERRARDAGAIDVLRKPVGKDELMRAIERAFAMPIAGRGDEDDG